MGWLIFHYQTLVAGILAIVAALASVWGLWFISDRERRRRLNARRALMPAQLSEIDTYASLSSRGSVLVRW